MNDFDNGVFLPFYGEINNGAHVKIADLIGSPAFVWHRAFWNPQRDSFPWAKRMQTLDGLVKDIHTNISSKFEFHLHNDLKEMSVREGDRNKVISLQFFWHGLLAKVRMEIHTEYLTITSSIDASFKVDDTHIRSDGDRRPAVQGYLKRLDELFCASSLNPEKLADAERLYENIYTELWQGFFTDVFKVKDYFEVKTDENGLARVSVGLVFADFRGLITSDAPSIIGGTPVRSTRTSKKTWSSIGAPYYRTYDGERGRPINYDLPTEQWARDRIDKSWTFLERGIVSDGAQPRVEFTVSRLLGGRMLYATALGPQYRNDPTPLCFYLHSATDCERQIGRMIERICRAGTLRLASVIAIPAIKDIGQKLRPIEKQIEETRRSIHELITATRMLSRRNLGDQSSLEDEQLKILDFESLILANLGTIRSNIVQLSTGPTDQNSQNIGDASLEYRLIRSRYYRSMLDTIWKSMRIQRLEGYQPYDAFVKTRLESAQAFISGLEERLGIVKRDWRSLDQLYLTTAVTLLTGQIQEQQATSTHIQNRIEKIQEISAEAQSASTKAQIRIQKIQKAGEVFFLMAPFPYYLLGFEHYFVSALGLEHGSDSAHENSAKPGLPSPQDGAPSSKSEAIHDEAQHSATSHEYTGQTANFEHLVRAPFDGMPPVYGTVFTLSLHLIIMTIVVTSIVRGTLTALLSLIQFSDREE